MLRIKQILKEKGITAKELASKLCITESGLSQIISSNDNRKANPTINTLKDIADALDVSIVELFADSVGEHTFTCQCGRKYKITPIEE